MDMYVIDEACHMSRQTCPDLARAFLAGSFQR